MDETNLREMSRDTVSPLISEYGKRALIRVSKDA
jgi:hypothetical protein